MKHLIFLFFLSHIVYNVEAKQNFGCDFRPTKNICEGRWWGGSAAKKRCEVNNFYCKDILDADIPLEQKLTALVVKVQNPDGSIKPVRLNHPPGTLKNYVGKQPGWYATPGTDRKTMKEALQESSWIKKHIPKDSKVIDIAHNGFIFSEDTELIYPVRNRRGKTVKFYELGKLGELLKSISYGKEKYDTKCSYLNLPITRGKDEYSDKTEHHLRCYVHKTCLFKDNTLVWNATTCYTETWSYQKKCPESCFDYLSENFDKHFKKIKQCEEPTIELITKNSGLSDDSSLFKKTCAVLYSCSLKGYKHEVTDICSVASRGICPSIKDCVQQAQAISEKQQQTPQKQPENAQAKYQNWLKSLDIKKGKRVNEKAVMNPEPTPPQPNLDHNLEYFHPKGSVK